MSVIARPFRPTDYDAAIAVSHAASPDRHESPALWQEADTDFGESRHRCVAVDTRTRQVVGHALIEQTPNRAEQSYTLWLVASPDCSPERIWDTLLDDILKTLRAREARHVGTQLSGEEHELAAFLQSRGFTEGGRFWASELSLPDADLTPFAPLMRQIAARGIVLTTLQDEREVAPDCLHRLWDADREIWADHPHRPRDWDGWRQRFDAMHVLPDLFFLARLGDCYLGYSSMVRSEVDRLHQSMTAVRPSARRQGVATALKVYGIDRAKRHGFRAIVTSSSDTNTPMLSLNAKLGFQRRDAWITFGKSMGANALGKAARVS